MTSSPTDQATCKTAPENVVGQPFNPYKRFTGIFIPEPICKYKGLSPAAPTERCCAAGQGSMYAKPT